MSAGTFSNPIVIVANYLFDTLVHDFFQVEGWLVEGGLVEGGLVEEGLDEGGLVEGFWLRVVEGGEGGEGGESEGARLHSVQSF